MAGAPADLQHDITALVNAAVDRALQAATAAAPGADPVLAIELRQARQENEELRAVLREVQAVDDAEFRRLWAIIGERAATRMGRSTAAHAGCAAG